MTDSIRLAELLCARLCHDLAGPVGAAAAGAELIEEMGAEADPDTLGLVAASAAGAAARLKFLRAALGPASESPQPAAKLGELARAYIEAGSASGPFPCTLDWRVGSGDVGGREARLLLNLVLLARDCLPKGGRITVEAASVAAEGEAAALPGEAAEALAGTHHPEGPRAAQAVLARLLAGEANRPLTVEKGQGSVLFSIRRYE